jgi:hypothetical protein
LECRLRGYWTQDGSSAALKTKKAKARAPSDATNATMLRIVSTWSGFAGDVDGAAARLDAEVVTAVIPDCGGRTPEGWVFVSGWVCCIFTVALGRAGAALFGASLGRLMRAVSFFGDDGFVMTPDAGGAGCGTAPDGGAGGAGLRGTVGLPENGGGFGGGVDPLTGRESGGGAGGLEGRLIGGGIAPEPGRITLEVSFLGAGPDSCEAASGTLTRTVSRLAMGSSDFGGNVILMVSFLSDSSSWGVVAEGFSSAMAWYLDRSSISIAGQSVNRFVP